MVKKEKTCFQLILNIYNIDRALDDVLLLSIESAISLQDVVRGCFEWHIGTSPKFVRINGAVTRDWHYDSSDQRLVVCQGVQLSVDEMSFNTLPPTTMASSSSAQTPSFTTNTGIIESTVSAPIVYGTLTTRESGGSDSRTPHTVDQISVATTEEAGVLLITLLLAFIIMYLFC